MKGGGHRLPYTLALGTAGFFRDLILITNLNGHYGCSQLGTLAMIALSCLRRLRMAR
jgi:hypothetical protein